VLPGGGWWLTIRDPDEKGNDVHITRERVVAFARVDRPDGAQHALIIEAMVPSHDKPGCLEIARDVMDNLGDLMHDGDSICGCVHGNDEGGSPRRSRGDPGWCTRCGGEIGEVL
jgi:hypothetical protein